MTARKSAANARNAQHSTGPRSKEGKEVSSRNAITHGLTARDNLIFGESEEAYEALRNEMWQTWEPVGASEQNCVAELVRGAWRMARGARIETALFVNESRRHADQVRGIRPRYVSRSSYILSSDYEPGGDPNELEDVSWSEEEIEEAPLRELADIYTSGTGDELRKLGRHEGAIHARYRAALHDLMALQKRRLG